MKEKMGVVTQLGKQRFSWCVHLTLPHAPAVLGAKNLAPSEHLVDSAYVSADHLITARE